MNVIDQHRTAVADELDEILAVLPLVADDADLSEHLFARVVDLLVEELFLDLREQHAEAHIDAPTFAVTRAALVRECRAVGLLPPSTDPNS